MTLEEGGEGKKTGLEGTLKYSGEKWRILIFFFQLYFSAPCTENFYYTTDTKAVVT